MPQWLPLKKDDVLPLFVQQRPASINIPLRIIRKWNSLHSLNRSFFIAVFILIVFALIYMQMISLPNQVDLIQEDTSNVSSFIFEY